MDSLDHRECAPAALVEALAAAPADVEELGDLIARHLLGDLGEIASVSLYDELTDRVELIGVAASRPFWATELRRYLEEVAPEVRRRFNAEIVADGTAVATDLTLPDVLPDRRPDFLGREVIHNLVVPLRTSEQVLGTVQVGRGFAYGPDDVAAAAAAGRLSGRAVATALLVRRLGREQRITRAMAGNVGLEPLFGAVLPELREILGVDTARLLIMEETGRTLRVGLSIGLERDSPGARVPVGHGFAGRIAARRRALIVEDVTDFAFVSEGLRRSGVASMAGVPVLGGDEVLGVLHVGSFSPRRFRAEDLDLLALVADRLALALSQARVEAALNRTQALAQSVLDAAADAILTFDGHGRVRSANRRVEQLFGHAEAELVGRSIQLLVPDLDVGRGRPGASTRLAGEPGEVVGHRRDGTAFPVELSVSEVGDQTHGGLFTAILRDISERKASEAQLRHQALHDRLTDLPNRALFGEHLARALARRGRENRRLAVMFLDLDGFKVVNDSLGHATGDELLRQVAERLRRAVRPTDVLARLGGDEFAVLLEGTMPLAATTVARRILRRLREPIEIDQHRLEIATSIGIAHTLDGAASAGDLLRHADAAMYRAKAKGRGRFEVFDEPMRASLAKRLRTENELHAALAEGQIAVHYQPVLDLRSRRVAHVEALARWCHPERGTLAAGEFIGVAEETGLIKPLGVEVAVQAARQLRRWREELADDPPEVAINLSASQLAVPLDPILEATDDQIDHLAVEIGETTLTREMTRVDGLLRELKTRGATILVDGFGTGAASLPALKRLPIDAIKIDRVLVATIESSADERAIVHGIIELAHALGIAVAAEGVETPGQLTILEELGCDFAQGYLISPPRPAGEVFALAH